MGSLSLVGLSILRRQHISKNFLHTSHLQSESPAIDLRVNVGMCTLLCWVIVLTAIAR